MYSVMWSEHCSYKSSKVHLRQFGEKKPRDATRLMVGIGENAGVVDIGEGWAVTFKVESHNHPSYIEPYQGAATGVGGIVRDIISMGARPVAVMDPLRFGAIDHPDTAPRAARRRRRHRRLRQLPRPAQHRRRDRVRPVLPGQPARQRARASACCATRTSTSRTPRASATRSCSSAPAPAATASAAPRILASETFDDGGPTKRPARAGRRPVRREGAHRVLPRGAARRPRRGHPGPRRRRHLVRDERAGRATASGGMRVDLDKVLLRDPTLTPEEILMSESQERMMAIVAPEKLDAFLAVCAKWDVETSVHRRGHRHRPPRDRVARRGHRRRAAAHRRRTTARSTSARTPARPGSTRCRPTTRRRARAPGDRRRAPRDRAARWSRSPNLATRPGSPTSTTATCWATPCSRSPTTPA